MRSGSTNATSTGPVAENINFRYNILMRSLLTILATALLLALPFTAVAQQFIEPEQIVDLSRNPRLLNQINAQKQQEQMQAQNAQRPTLHEWYLSSSSASATAADTTATPAQTSQQDTATPPVVNASDTQESTSAFAGAPLASSGPAEDVTVAVVLFAVGFTLYRVRKMERNL